MARPSGPRVPPCRGRARSPGRCTVKGQLVDVLAEAALDIEERPARLITRKEAQVKSVADRQGQFDEFKSAQAWKGYVSQARLR